MGPFGLGMRSYSPQNCYFPLIPAVPDRRLISAAREAPQAGRCPFAPPAPYVRFPVGGWRVRRGLEGREIR